MTKTFIDVNFILHSSELQTFETSIKMATQERLFGSKNYKYIFEEKKTLAAKVKECKQQYDDEVEAMKGKTHWDAKRKRHVPDTPKVSGIFQRRALILFQHKSGEK